MSISTISAGLNGMQRATYATNQAAQNIVNKSFVESDSSSMVNDLVALKQNSLLFAASGKVIQAGINTSGSLIDILV